MTEIQKPLLLHFQNLRMFQRTDLEGGVRMNKIKISWRQPNTDSKGEKMETRWLLKYQKFAVTKVGSKNSLPVRSRLFVYAPCPPLAQSADGSASKNHGNFFWNCSVEGRPSFKSDCRKHCTNHGQFATRQQSALSTIYKANHQLIESLSCITEIKEALHNLKTQNRSGTVPWCSHYKCHWGHSNLRLRDSMVAVTSTKNLRSNASSRQFRIFGITTSWTLDGRV